MAGQCVIRGAAGDSPPYRDPQRSCAALTKCSGFTRSFAPCEPRSVFAINGDEPGLIGLSFFRFAGERRDPIQEGLRWNSSGEDETDINTSVKTAPLNTPSMKLFGASLPQGNPPGIISFCEFDAMAVDVFLVGWASHRTMDLSGTG